MIQIIAALSLGVLLWVPAVVQATGVYMTPEAFVAEAFPGRQPQQAVLWLTGDVRADLAAALGRAPTGMRMRYWVDGQRTVWILDEIGKEKPITVGIVVDNGAIHRVEVLEFRESRGWEVRLPAFTRQFVDSVLTADKDLDRHIDGITGATLSVAAMKKVARAALLLDRHASESRGMAARPSAATRSAN